MSKDNQNVHLGEGDLLLKFPDDNAAVEIGWCKDFQLDAKVKMLSIEAGQSIYPISQFITGVDMKVSVIALESTLRNLIAAYGGDPNEITESIPVGSHKYTFTADLMTPPEAVLTYKVPRPFDKTKFIELTLNRVQSGGGLQLQFQKLKENTFKMEFTALAEENGGVKTVGTLEMDEYDPEYFAEFTVVTNSTNQVVAAGWNDADLFPQYVAEEWDSFGDFLTSLGTFVIDYGDGVKARISMDDLGYTHTYAAAGTYTLTIWSPYVFVSSAYITAVGDLAKLKNLVIDNSDNISAPPVLAGLAELELLSITECAGIVTPPALAGLTALKTVDMTNCKLLVAGVNAILTALTVAGFTALDVVSLKQDPATVPTGGTKSAFISAHPAVTLTTD